MSHSTDTDDRGGGHVHAHDDPLMPTSETSELTLISQLTGRRACGITCGAKR